MEGTKRALFEAPPYVLFLMGRVELRDPEGRRVILPTRKTVLLLAMLTLAPNGHRRPELANSLWPEVEDGAARAGLRTALSALRKALPPGSLQRDGDTVSLQPGTVEADLEEETGAEFMPGFDHDWAIDHRLRLREGFVRKALARAEAESSLAWAERACAADPLCAQAAALRIRLLESQGREEEAVVHGDAFRARSIRELGVVADVRPPATLSEHPLIAAVEWALDRDPEEACALLVGTQGQWMALPVRTARSVHQRVLAATKRASRERRFAEASFCCFAAMEGKLGKWAAAAETGYFSAVDSSELPAAARLCEALAYANLSKGDDPQAVRWAQAGLHHVENGADQLAWAAAEMALAIVEQHTQTADPTERFDSAARKIEEHGSALAVTSVLSVRIATWMALGEIERAVRDFEVYRRKIAVFGGERLLAWTIHIEALLHERTGDLEAARGAFERLREAAPAAGQCAVGIADEGLMRINCRLREFDEAATALARVTLYRRRMGTVPSRLEQATAAPAVRVLKERLSATDIRAAFQRATA